MKHLILITAAVVTICTSSSFAQCSKSQGYDYHALYQQVVRRSSHNIESTHPRYVRPVLTCSIQHPDVTRPQSPSDTHIDEHPQVAAGQQVTIDGQNFGTVPGRILIRTHQQVLEGTVVGWTDHQITVVMPDSQLSQPEHAIVFVRTVAGRIAERLHIELMPGTRHGQIAAPSDVPTVSPGQAVTLEGSNLGFQTGRIQIAIGGRTLDATVQRWSNNEVIAVLPQLSLSNSAQATVQIVRADGSVADQLEVVLAPVSVAAVAIR
jgi:hypothetical protein